MNPSHLFINAESAYLDWLPGRLIRNRHKSIKSEKNFNRHQGMTTGQLLTSVDPLPPRSILLGRCQDGLPLLMGLSNPEIGAILIGGDPGSGKTHHIQVLVDSATRTHAPHDLQVVVLTHKPDEWDLLFNDDRARRYFQSCHAWYDRRAEDVIQSLYNLAGSRRDSQKEGPTMLFILDDLNFVEILNFEAQFQLHWLLTYGAQSNIWVIGAINASLAGRYRFWLESFRTRIIGRVRSSLHLSEVTLQDEIRMKTLEPSTFRVWSGKDWMTYQIPLLGD